MTWSHRMVICRKHNGDPRRTVDMHKLNNVSVRQCHPTQSPLQQAMTVPHNTKKSVLDAWNGYHSVRIREEDRHLTTFYTKSGRYRYRSAPQGFQASGDAYTHRYKITMGVKDVKRVIDDTRYCTPVLCPVAPKGVQRAAGHGCGPLKMFSLPTKMIIFHNQAQRLRGTTAQQPAHVEQPARNYLSSLSSLLLMPC